jgi:hypothetical protein
MCGNGAGIGSPPTQPLRRRIRGARLQARTASDAAGMGLLKCRLCAPLDGTTLPRRIGIAISDCVLCAIRKVVVWEFAEILSSKALEIQNLICQTRREHAGSRREFALCGSEHEYPVDSGPQCWPLSGFPGCSQSIALRRSFYQRAAFGGNVDKMTCFVCYGKDKGKNGKAKLFVVVRKCVPSSQGARPRRAPRKNLLKQR